MKTKTITKTVSFKEKVLADIKSKHPHYAPNKDDLGLMQGFDDVVNGRFSVWKPKTK